MMGVFSPWQHRFRRSSREDVAKRESVFCLTLRSFLLRRALNIEGQRNWIDFDESEVVEVGRMSLEEKIGIGDRKVLLAKPWRSGDSERMQISILFCFVCGSSSLCLLC